MSLHRKNEGAVRIRVAADRRLNVGQECVATVEPLLPALDPTERELLLSRALLLLQPRAESRTI